MMLLVFDLILLLVIAVLAWRSLNDRDLFRAVVKFTALGLLMAVAWVRLRAPDVALAEAAVGSGLTGALILSALVRMRRRERSAAQALDGSETSLPPESRTLSFPRVFLGALSLALLVALAAAVVAVVDLVVLTREVLASGVQLHRVGGWGAPLGIDLRADGLAVLMLVITALIASAVTLYSARYFLAARDAGALHRERYFWPLFLFMWTALNALFLTADIFNLYVTLELLGFAAITLVALAGWLALAATVVAFWKAHWLAGAVLVPYLAWVPFASALSFTLWQLNS